MSHECGCHEKTFWSRRDFLFRSGGGLAGVALANMLHREGLLGAERAGLIGGQQVPGPCDEAVPGNPFAPKSPHFAPRATAVISLFMSGGVSHVDTFDPKPALTRYAGQPLDGKVDGNIVVRQGFPGPLMPSPFEFNRYGESGIEVSEIFPHLARHVDEIAFLRSVYGRSNDHVQATYEMQTGQIRMGYPSVGSWVTYGLGAESSSLPAFVVMTDHRGGPLGGPGRGIFKGDRPGAVRRRRARPWTRARKIGAPSRRFDERSLGGGENVGGLPGDWRRRGIPGVPGNPRRL